MQFGRRAEPVRTPPPCPADKWALLNALTVARGTFELSHRTLGVLKALLTFLPGREIPDDPQAAIVFPSNRVLSERLNGMPESTLRRHLAALVRAGIVSRQDSPNRKRYARRLGQRVALSFGFDLSPLARNAARILEAADAERASAEARAVERSRLGALCHQLAGQGDADLLAEARRLLRRVSPVAELAEMCARIEALLAVENRPEPARVAEEMSASDSRNERHIQHEDDYDSESAEPWETSARGQAKPSETPDLSEVVNRCGEYRSLFPAPVRDWAELVARARRLGPMMGIEASVLDEAHRDLGPKAAATAVLVILEKGANVRSPGAYLRHLCQTAHAGAFSARRLLASLNARNCQLTI
jgi:replication initiation protein RepC